jgi:hypothetical protein
LRGWSRAIGQGHFGQANREFSIAVAAKHFEGDREANGERIFSPVIIFAMGKRTVK